MKLVLKDFFGFGPKASREGGPSSDPNVRQAAQNGKYLKIDIVSSHAGMVNGNKVMYSPIGMKNSCHTFTWPQPKPIQVHHDDHSDPIGRVISAGFVEFNAEASTPQRDALNILMDSDSKEKVVKAAKALEGLGVLESSSWRGVGEQRLSAIISDSAAIEKILDGRYHGVSITQYPQEAFCSICGQDWIQDGRCEHQRGIEDEESGRVMYLIVGDSVYSECSFVNKPADGHAQKTDHTFVNPQTQDSLPQEDAQDQLYSEIKFSIVDSIQPMEGEEEVVISDEESSDPKDENTDTNNTETTEEGSTELTLEDSLQTLFEDEDNFTEEMSLLINDAIEEEVELEDAKLTTKKRKALPASSFCGPNKSFPVPDCAHVTAARRLVGKYEGPGDKSKILACVSRKEKSLGCEKASDSTEEVKDSTCTKCNDFITWDEMTDEQLVKEYTNVRKLMINRDMEIECSDCSSRDQELNVVKESVGELNDTIKVLRQEWTNTVTEFRSSEESHIDTLRDFENILRSYATLVTILNEKEKEEDQIKSDILEKTVDELKNIINLADMSEIIQFIRSGMVRQPEGTVDLEDAQPEEVTPSPEENKYLKTIVNTYRSAGSQAAVTFMDNLKKLGKISTDLTLDNVLESMAK